MTRFRALINIKHALSILDNLISAANLAVVRSTCCTSQSATLSAILVVSGLFLASMDSMHSADSPINENRSRVGNTDFRDHHLCVTLCIDERVRARCSVILVFNGIFDGLPNGSGWWIQRRRRLHDVQITLVYILEELIRPRRYLKICWQRPRL
jgi:hypothetical protein